MEVMLFDDKEALLEYTADENYQILDNYPGVCFGLSLEIEGTDKFDAYYHFMD